MKPSSAENDDLRSNEKTIAIKYRKSVRLGNSLNQLPILIIKNINQTNQLAQPHNRLSY